MISIIVATCNSARTLERCLASIAAQRDASFELLVADGGSTDGTCAILGASRTPIAWQRSEPDGGVYDAWNKAIPRAAGEWIMFLGSDDWLDQPDILARLSFEAERLTPAERRYSYIFGKTLLIEQGRTIEQLGIEPLPGGRLDPDADVSFSHTGLLHHRSLFERFGLYDASFRSAGDYEFLLRTGLDPRVRFHRTPLTVAHMASGGMSTGAASRGSHYREMVRARAKHHLRPDPAWLRKARARAACLHFLDRRLGPRVALAASNLYRRLCGKTGRGAI